MATGPAVKYDALVGSAISFVAKAAGRSMYKEVFADVGTLTTLCQRVVVPNMTFREEDEDMFADDATEYIRRDLEGSDAATRRRAACELVRGLCVFYEGPVTEIFQTYVNALLAVSRWVGPRGRVPCRAHLCSRAALRHSWLP